MPVNIVIADDHALLASGMRAALEELPGVTVVDVAANGIQAIALIKQHRPDCAVIDLSMPGANGLEVFLEGKRWSPRTRFVVVTGNPAPALFEQMIEAGVDGIFLKHCHPDEICTGVLSVLSGGKAIASQVRQLLEAQSVPPGLTARELEVLHAIGRGHSNKHIGETLGISAKTVDSHRTSLMRKMGTRTVATLLVKAMRAGLIDV